MKKTLAILLALLMAGSIVLASCDTGRKPSSNDGGNDDNDYVGDESDSESGSESDSESESQSNTQTGNTDNYGWIEKNDTVYAGYGMNVYADSSTDAGIIYDKIKVGDALSRISTNGTFDKISINVNGETKTGYVVSKWVSTINNFSFTEIEAKNLEVIAEQTALSMFTTPHIVMNGSDYEYKNIICKGGLTKAAFSAGYTLTAIGENTNWIKVEFVGKITLSGNEAEGTAENPLILYINKKHIEGRVKGFGSTGSTDNV